MKNQRKVRRPARGLRRPASVIVVAAALVAVGAVTVLSRQSERRAQMAAKTQIVNARLASQDVPVKGPEPQELSADDAQKIAAGMKDLVNQSTDGLVEVQHADGSVSVDLDGRFQNVTVARVNKDGSISQSCVDNRKAAAAFFGIDPKLIDPNTGSRKPVKAPVRDNNQ